MNGDDLHMWRRQRRMRQADLADLLGISWHQISRMETGRIEIPRWLPLALAGIETPEPSEAMIEAAAIRIFDANKPIGGKPCDVAPLAQQPNVVIGHYRNLARAALTATTNGR